MKFIIVTLIIDFLLILSMYFQPSSRFGDQSIIVFVSFIAWIVFVIGFICLLCKKHRSGMLLLIIGCIFSLPVGVFVIIGGNKLRAENDAASERALIRRRQSTHPGQTLDIVAHEDQSNTTLETLNFKAVRLTMQQRVHMCVVGLIINIFFIPFSGNNGLFISFTILAFIVPFLLNNNAYITLGGDYIAVKIGLGVQVNVLFKEIVSVDKTSKSMAIHYRLIDDTGNKKKIVLILNNMLNEEREKFLQAFAKRIAIA